MRDYYIETNSFAAPFCSDTGFVYVSARTPRLALEQAAAQYRHPAGLYAALCYTSADAKNKGEKPLAKWLCNHELAKARLTEGRSAYTFMGISPDEFEIDGKRHKVDDPKGGRVLEDPQP
jgi:hypothetical protein